VLVKGIAQLLRSLYLSKKDAVVFGMPDIE
jgi:hypothetical protein